MTDVPHDLFGFEAPSEEQLNSISKWATKALDLQAEIEQAEAYLAGKKSELRQIVEIDLPRALLEAGTLEFTTTSGSKITIDDVIQGGFSKEPNIRQFIFDWVVHEGGQEIIKDHFEVDFTRGSYEEAVALRNLLREHHINFDEFENIHTGTLYAFLKEKLRDNTMPPFEKMGLRYFKRADIKVPKKAE